MACGSSAATSAPTASSAPSAPASGRPALPTLAPPPPPLTFGPGSEQVLPSGTFALSGDRAYTENAPAEPYPPVTLAEVALASGARRTLVTRPPGHVLSDLLLDGDRLLWAESWYVHPQPANGETGGNPNAGQPLLWQIVSYSLTNGILSVLASGSDSNLPLIGEAASPQPPVLAAAGDRIAYAMDTGTNGSASSTLVVRSLSTNAVLRSMRTTGYVVQVGLAGQALFYRQTDDGFAPDSSLLLARSDAGQPMQVATLVSHAAMDSESLVWSRSDATDASIWMASPGGGTSGPAAPVRIGAPSGPVRQPGPTSDIAIGDHLVAWIAWFDTPDAAADSELIVWVPGEAEGRVVAGLRQPDWVQAQHGMLAWHESLPLPGHPDTHAVPASAVPLDPQP